MQDTNIVVLTGRLVRDSELKYTASGTPVCKFSLAVNCREKVQNEWKDVASFFDVVTFSKQGEALSKMLLKGKQVNIKGELKQDRWQQEGQSRSKVGIIANNIQLLGSTPQQVPVKESAKLKVDNEGYSNEVPF